MMLTLPSGQRVGICGERARMHAEDKAVRLDEQAPLEALYPLIDIVFPRPAGHLSTVRPFEFSGHTLDDTPWLARWPAADRRAFLEWLEQTPQRQEIERARRRIACRALPERVRRFDYGERLYSRLLRQVAELPLGRASPEHWKRTLLKLRARGVRAEEIEWSGVLGFLEAARRGGKATVHKQEIIERIDFSPIRLELRIAMERQGGCGLRFKEVAKRLEGAALEASGLNPGPDELALVRWEELLQRYRIGVLRRREQRQLGQAQRTWFLLDGQGHALADEQSDRQLFESRAQAEALANRNACALCATQGELGYARHYEYLSLDGGEQYREWLLTLPDYARSFFGSHYHERNILLHIRSKIRRDREGRKLLFIEEIQSDWHQAGRRHGFDKRGEIPPAPFRNEWLGLGLKLMLLHAAESGCDALAWADGAVQQQRYGQAQAVLSRIYDRQIPATLQALAGPEAPFPAHTWIATRRPWLQAVRVKQRWRVTDSEGRFRTQPRYTLDEAYRLMNRHSKKALLKVPLFELSAALRARLRQQGLPLFGL